MGLFGESIDDLAKKEMEAKRNYSAKHGVEVNTNINDMKLGDKIINQNKSINKRSKFNRYMAYLLFGLVALLIVLLVYEKVTRPKPDYVGFNKEISTYLSQIDNVKSYRVSSAGDDIYYITIDKSSWSGSDLDKVTYCSNVRKTFTAYGWKYNIINKNESMGVIFETEDGVTLAEPNGVGLSDYEIKY